MPSSRRCLIIGTGRAGGSLAAAMRSIGWGVSTVAGRSTVRAGDLVDVDLVLLAVADDAVASVSAALPHSGAVVAHVAGSLTLDVLAGHGRVGSLHPLMSLPDPATGADRLLDRCTFAVAGDPMVEELVDELGGTAIRVADEQRALYHATATIAANHLTALCGQVERLAASIGVPASAYWALMSTTLANVERVGAAEALTGPAARGDHATLGRHLDSLPDDRERELYRALSDEAVRLAVGRTAPI